MRQYVSFPVQINRMPSAFAASLSGLFMGYKDTFEIVIAGSRKDKSTKEILDFFGRNFIPNKVILLKEPGETELTGIAPFTEQMVQQGDTASVYICRNYACEMPVSSIDEIKEILG